MEEEDRRRKIVRKEEDRQRMRNVLRKGKKRQGYNKAEKRRKLKVTRISEERENGSKTEAWKSKGKGKKKIREGEKRRRKQKGRVLRVVQWRKRGKVGKKGRK